MGKMIIVILFTSRRHQFVGAPFTNLDKLLKSQEPLGIFTSKDLRPSGSAMWKTFEKQQLQRCTKYEPLNWFDQCIVWTQEGKLWRFPIDNEQGKGLQKTVYRHPNKFIQLIV